MRLSDPVQQCFCKCKGCSVTDVVNDDKSISPAQLICEGELPLLWLKEVQMHMGKECYSCHFRAFSLSLWMLEHSNLHCKRYFKRSGCWHWIQANAALKALSITYSKDGTLDHWQVHFETFTLCLSREIPDPVQPFFMLNIWQSYMRMKDTGAINFCVFCGYSSGLHIPNILTTVSLMIFFMFSFLFELFQFQTLITHMLNFWRARKKKNFFQSAVEFNKTSDKSHLSDNRVILILHSLHTKKLPHFWFPESNSCKLSH